MPGSDGGLRRLLRKHLPQVHWTTIESRATERGIPDIEYCINGACGWIECKTTRGWAVRMRPMQIAWILRRVRAGGRVFIMVRQRSAKRDDLWLINGAAAQRLKEKSLAKLHKGQELSFGVTAESDPDLVGYWPGGPTLWSWREVLWTLTS